MKRLFVILSFFCSLHPRAQNNFYQQNEIPQDPFNTIYNSSGPYFSGSFSGMLLENGENGYLSDGERMSLSSYNSFTQPSPPLLTTNFSELEICTGNSTRLTASSNYNIYWYTTPPPLGTAVGTGSSYITPVLGTGYYTYYAIAENNGIKSDISAMEVVMVYPNPVLEIKSNASIVCANETATLTVSGTTYYEWENGPVSSQMTIRPDATQEYKVTGVNTAGCRSAAVYTQLVETCNLELTTLQGNRQIISGETAKEDKLFSVYPNPNNGEFNIRVNSISETTRVEVYNSFGHLNYSNKISDEVTSITLREYPNGIYIVRIIENDKVLRQEKIVKE